MRVPIVAIGAASLLLAGCEPAPPASRPEAEPDSPADSLARAMPAADDVVARWAARLPDSLRHRSGACPFECCVYGTWTGTSEIPVRGGPQRTLPIAFRIPADEPFQADSGFVRMTGVSVLVVEDGVDVGETRFEPGDTLVVLDYVGEGIFNVWDGARVHAVSGFWGAEVADPKATLLGGADYAREWWVHATTAQGRRGWIDADSVPRIRGADACGG